MSIEINHTSGGSIAWDRYKVIFAGISAVILTVGVARFSYTPFLHTMIVETGLSRFAGGILATLNYVGYLIGALLVARLHEADSKFLLYRQLLVVAVVSTVAMAWTQNVYIWAALRVTSGLSSVAGMLLAAGFVFDWLRRNGFQAELGLHFARLGLGIVVSGLAAIAMQDHLHWNEQWEAMGILGIFFFVPAWKWMPKPTAIATSSQAVTVSPARSWMLLVTLAYFCAGFGYVISATFIVAILETIPNLTGKGAWIWVLLGLAAIPASFIWDRIADRLGYIKALILGYILQIISIVIPAATDAFFPNLFAAFLFGITVTGIVSLMLSLVGRKYPSNSSSAMAKLTATYGVSQIIAPAIAGVMAATWGGYRGSLWMAAGMI